MGVSMNYSNFKEYLNQLGTDVRGFGNMLNNPEQEVDPDTGEQSWKLLNPMINDLVDGRSPGVIEDFYVWLHTAARELSNDAKYAIETIDETSPEATDVRAVAELAEQVKTLNELVTNYGQRLAKAKPWTKMLGSTMEVYRFWNDRSGANHGTPEKRGMEPRKLPTASVKIVVIEDDNGNSRAAISCSDNHYRRDESIPGAPDIGQAFVFDVPKMIAGYLGSTSGGRVRARTMGVATMSREDYVLETMQLSKLLVHGIADMAETMHKHGYLVDTDNLYMLRDVAPYKPGKGVLSEENPDAIIEIGSWS